MQAVKNLVSSAAGSEPQYLTGDKAGIDAFIDKFDVSYYNFLRPPNPLISMANKRYRSSFSTAMVHQLFHALYERIRSDHD